MNAISSTSAPDCRALPAAILALTAPAAGLGSAIQGVPVGWCAAGGLTLAALTWMATSRARRPVAVVAPVADICAIAAGRRGIPERGPSPIGAT